MSYCKWVWIRWLLHLQCINMQFLQYIVFLKHNSTRTECNNSCIPLTVPLSIQILCKAFANINLSALYLRDHIANKATYTEWAAAAGSLSIHTMWLNVNVIHSTSEQPRGLVATGFCCCKCLHVCGMKETNKSFSFNMYSVFSILDHSISNHGNSEHWGWLWHHRHLMMSLRGMECDINSTFVQRNYLINEIGEIHFHGRFGRFLQIGLSHDVHWTGATTVENEFVP